MIERTGRFMEQRNMVCAGDTVLVGLSGGADSVCLCLVLKELSARMGFSLSAVHVEHGIRGGESLRDAAFAEAFCRNQQIPCSVVRVDVPAYADANSLGEEEAARILRYRAFAQEAGRMGSVRVALAHHMEDNAETMLFHMVRGSGLDGLCGMPAVRTDEAGTVFIRPLLGESRPEIEKFLTERGQSYCEDSTNAVLACSRNRIRHLVLPELVRVNKKAVAHMNRTAERLWELRDYVEEETGRAYENVVKCRGCGREAEWFLSAEPLFSLPQVIAQRIIHRAVAEAAGAKRDIGAVHIEAVGELFRLQCGRRVQLPGGIWAHRVYGGVCLRRGEAVPGKKQPGQFVSAGALFACVADSERLLVPFGEDGAQFLLRAFPGDGKRTEISGKMYTKWFDYDKIKDGFSIRNRESGDYFVMDGAGHRKKLERYFIDRKVPPPERDRIPVMAQGAEVLWVIGGRMGRSGMITESTRTIVEIVYQGGEEDGLQQKAQH